jgi:hypothetical protein
MTPVAARMLPYTVTSMSFQWLHMRITEEKERREREAQILARLPRALNELQDGLAECVNAFASAFGAESVSMTREDLRLTISAGGKRVEITADPELPGFRIEREGFSMAVQVGVLPGDKLFFLDKESDQYLMMDEVTRRVLDRVLFPKLRE